MTKSVRMTRRVGFSSGHRYWVPGLSDRENLDLFGHWASPYNHGHNYVLDVQVEGLVDSRTGMVVNIKRIDDALRATIVRQFDGKSLNDQVPYFHDHTTSLENLVVYVADCLAQPGVLPTEVQLTALRLEEMPTLFVELEMEESPALMLLTRTYEFAASHRLDSPHLSPDENIELFGKCNNAAGHGHNYLLEVTISGTPDPRTGMILSLDDLDLLVSELVVDRYDHKNLNVDIPEFDGKITTSEVVALEIFDRLKDHLPAKLRRVRLHETARNVFEVTG
jgi:6-pyruvoyltetrahydropterin/6-carboxytetrahydropterin synthase